MKHLLKSFAILLLAAFPLTLAAQGATVILDYMKVTPENESAYLEVEKTWKEVHRMRIEAGLISGWQLWRNVYAAPGDDYQYVTITWFNDWAQSLAPVPEGFNEKVFTELDLGDDFFAKTLASRNQVDRDVSHRMIEAENSQGANYILVNQMKVKDGMEYVYLGQEQNFWKPMQEEAIRRGYMSHWGVWQIFPYEEGQARYVTVDGFRDVAQLTQTDTEDLLPVVHPDTTWEAVLSSVASVRVQAAIDLWELVDAVFPEEE
jgi:hypothetical protein